MCKELFKLARAAQPAERPVSGSKFLQWYFFGVAAFWMYFRLVYRPCPAALLVGVPSGVGGLA